MRRLRPYLLLLPALLVVLALLVMPVIGTSLVTLQTGRGFALYQRFLSSGFNESVILRTLRIAFVTTALSLPFGFVAAYVLARAPRPVKSILLIAAMFPLLTSTVVRSFAFMVILGHNGVLNDILLRLGLVGEPTALLYTEFSVVLGLVYLFVPLMILSLVGVLEAIEADLVLAAASLGAGPGAAFCQVVLPLATPGLIVGSVLVFTGSFTAFATPQLLGGDRQVVLATLLYQKAMVGFDWVGASTIAVVMMVITITVLLGMNRLARRANPAAA